MTAVIALLYLLIACIYGMVEGINGKPVTLMKGWFWPIYLIGPFILWTATNLSIKNDGPVPSFIKGMLWPFYLLSLFMAKLWRIEQQTRPL